MEENTFGSLPPELWSHILTFVNGLDDLINLKLVNIYLSQEIEDPSRAFVAALNISSDILKCYKGRDTAYSIPRQDLIDWWRPSKHRPSPNKGIRHKCILLGGPGVGKTSFNCYLAGRPFKGEYEPTVGHDMFVDPDGITSQLQMWDRGQEKFSPLVVFRPYYQGARVLLLCFSVDKRASFEQLIHEYIPGVCQDMQHLFSTPPALYLLGLKADVENDTRQVSTFEAKALARALSIKYYECSAKSGYNVIEIAQRIKDDLLLDYRTPAPSASEGRRWCSIV